MQMDKNLIIEKLKNNKRYVNNEDLTETIVDIVLERSKGVIEDLQETSVINRYLDKIISKTVIEVLRAEGRYRLKSIIPLQKIDYKNVSYDSSKYKLSLTPVSKLKQIYTMFDKSDEKNGTEYKKVLEYKYKEKQKIKEVAQLMNVEEQFVVDTLFDMSEVSDKVARV